MTLLFLNVNDKKTKNNRNCCSVIWLVNSSIYLYANIYCMAGHRCVRSFSSYRSTVHYPIYIANSAVVSSFVYLVFICSAVLGYCCRNKIGKEVMSDLQIKNQQAARQRRVSSEKLHVKRILQEPIGTYREPIGNL